MLKPYRAFAHPVSKITLNAITGWLAAELADTPKVVVRAATLPADGPTGTFFDVSGPVPW